MNPARKFSSYMEWAKLSAAARFNLATSGLVSVTMREFPLRLEELEITMPGGHGYAPLCERIAQHDAVPVECVVTAEGTSMANHLALAALLEPGGEVVLEVPTYGLLLDLLRYFRASVRRIERRAENDFALIPEELKAVVTPATRLIILTNLHNPTGALIPIETLQAAGEIAEGVGALVLVDEVYRELLFDHPMPTSFSLGENFIVTNSLTKTYGLSGLRCGWILAPPEIAQRMRRLYDLFAANSAHPAERMSVMAFDHLHQFRDRARRFLDPNRQLLDRFLDHHPELPCFRPPAGTICFPRLPRGMPESFHQLLRTKFETSVVPGEFFESKQHFRLGIGGPGDEVREGLERLGAALAEFLA
jgi:aspartate/methionine/tyrosine aminotransferase